MVSYNNEFKSMVEQQANPRWDMIKKLYCLFPDKYKVFSDLIIAIIHYGNDIGADISQLTAWGGTDSDKYVRILQ